MRSTLRACAALAVLLSASGVDANDGRDRYRGPTPAELRLFDPPVSDELSWSSAAE